jgi:hypothetical protein
VKGTIIHLVIVTFYEAFLILKFLKQQVRKH